jgi:hypothetical protein
MTDCEIMRLEKAAMIRVLHEEPAFSELFVSHLLARTIRVEADLVDQLFNSSEKRLARALLFLAHFGKEGPPEPPCWWLQWPLRRLRLRFRSRWGRSYRHHLDHRGRSCTDWAGLAHGSQLRPM